MVPLCAARISCRSRGNANFGPKITTLTNNRENGNMDIKMCFFNGKCQTGIEALESMYTLSFFFLSLSLSIYICVYMTILIRRIVTLKPSWNHHDIFFRKITKDLRTSSRRSLNCPCSGWKASKVGSLGCRDLCRPVPQSWGISCAIYRI